MTLAHLRLIRDIAQLRSVSKAAQASEVSQSAASQTLTDIEQELGVMLFDRSTRPLTTMPAGKLYVEFCRDVLRRQEEMQAQLDAMQKKMNGVVRVAAIYSVGLSEVSQIESRFHARFPEAQLEMSYLRPEKVWDAVLRDRADLGLMSYAESSREILALPWRNEEMVVAVAPDHALAGRRSVTPGEMEGQDFVGFDDDLPIQSQIERYLREHRVSVQIVMHFDNLQMIKEAVAHGAGLSILPRRVMLDDVKSGRLKALALDPAELFRPLHIIHRRRRVFSAVTTGLLSLLKEDDRSHAA